MSIFRNRLPVSALLLAALLTPRLVLADDPQPRPATPAIGPDGAPASPPPPSPGGGAGGETTPGAEGGTPATGAGATTTTDRQKPPEISGAKTLTIDFQNTSLREMTVFFADLTGRNFILGEEKDLKETVTIISHKPVSASEAYEAFLQALELHGYTTVTVGKNTRIVKSSEAAQSPIQVAEGEDIAYSSNFVTQIIPLENVAVSDIQSVVTSLASPEAKVVAYAPSNTFIITDQSHNIRRIFKIINQLDIAAPRSKLEIIPIVHAQAADIKSIIEELYGTAASDSGGTAAATAASSRTAARTRRPARDATPEPTTEGMTAGKESKYISKVLADERTNAIIVLANEEGMTAVKELVLELDVDVDPSNRSQINVVYLEHAKAEDVASVLANLSQSGGSSSSQTAAQRARAQPAAPGRPGAAPARPGAAGAAADEGGGSGSVTAAFDSGMRITHDESTNSLVIIAAPDDFAVVRQVIDKLDIRRRQVFIDAVIVELASTDELEKGVAYHQPIQPSDQIGGIIGSQLGATSLGLTQDLLSGLAVGVFGPSVSIPITDPTTGTLTSIDVPAFGIVLQALRTAASVDIVSNPSLTTLDNEEAKIVVGRKVPFPTSTTFSQLGQPIVSFQREDVATTLKVIPRINSSNEVTLELTVEVSEVEEDSRGLDVNQAGFITSKREVQQVALVGDNETFVLGGLVGTTDTTVETKVPVLGDLPVLGVLFRGERHEMRRTNLMIFLTPHIIDDDQDMVDIYRIKEAQRKEFIRRFYGKSRDEQMQELQDLLQYSMNIQGQPSLYPTRASRPPGADLSTPPVERERELPPDEPPLDEDTLPEEP